MNRNMDQGMQERVLKWLSAFSWVLFFFFFFLLLFVGYSTWVEPYWIEVTYHTMEAPIGRAVKIAHLSDLHIRSIGRRERSILKVLEREKPDLILITGDFIIQPYDYGKVKDFLKMLKADLGVWGVRGNWDRAVPVGELTGYAEGSEESFYKEAGLGLLEGRNQKILEELYLLGWDDRLKDSKSMQAPLAGVPQGAFKIGLVHAPGFFELIRGRVDLVLAGHVHGGQVWFPGLGALHLPQGSGGYVAGWYQDSGTRMYVSRGLGNAVLEARLFCRPEVVFLVLASP